VRETFASEAAFAATVDDEQLQRYASLIVEAAANIRPGQLVCVNGFVEHAPLVRALTVAAYERGACYVDALYADQHVRRALIEQAPEESLERTPRWTVERLAELGERNGALIMISGDPAPDLFDDLDGARVARQRMPAYVELYLRLLAERRISWTWAAYPTLAWARLVYGKPDVGPLWNAIAHAVRLDEPEPVLAWREHLERLRHRAALLNVRRFDAIHFRGPGTDLVVGLLPQARWLCASDQTVGGILHVQNFPTEEVFTTPDRLRVDGVVRATRPLAILGAVAEDLVVSFVGGRVTRVEATSGAELVRAQMAADAGASRLGEVALVDGNSRVGDSGLTFFNTLFDENASCHIAYGNGVADVVDGAAALSAEERQEDGINQSAIHTDFMIGGPEVNVDGVNASGERVPLLRDNDWQLT
jgi:aminopeptidase